MDAQSEFKIIEESLFFFAFLSIQVIWNLLERPLGSLRGSREVLFGVDVAQREGLGGYFQGLKLTERDNSH